MKRVLSIGSITTDIIVTPADSVPASGTLRSVKGVSMHVGGCAANAAIDLAKLGVPVSLICRLGNDNFGKFVLSELKEYGVDTGAAIDPLVDTTGSVVCVSSAGERSFLYNPGSTGAMIKEDVTDEMLLKSDIVFVTGAFLLTSFDGDPCAEVMKKAQKLGKFTVMDTAWDFEDIWLPKIQSVLPHLDLFMPSVDEAAKITGENDLHKMAEKLFDLGVKSVIIKIGKDGALVCESRNERYILPTYSGVKPVDTTGAGDAFCAGFLAGLAMDWSYKESGRLGNACGTHCIMKIGASAGIKSLAEIQKFMIANREA